jgi:hypothetical protein
MRRHAVLRAFLRIALPGGGLDDSLEGSSKRKVVVPRRVPMGRRVISSKADELSDMGTVMEVTERK